MIDSHERFTIAFERWLSSMIFVTVKLVSPVARALDAVRLAMLYTRVQGETGEVLARVFAGPAHYQLPLVKDSETDLVTRIFLSPPAQLNSFLDQFSQFIFRFSSV